jgi:hypothetical protein
MSKKRDEAKVTDLAALGEIASAEVAEPFEIPEAPHVPETPTDPPGEAPVEPIAEPIAKPIAESQSHAMQLIDALRGQIAVLKNAKTSKRVASGSKARPNVTYVLLSKAPAWRSTPQIAQLQQILFDEAFLTAHRGEDGTVKVSEPELFAQVVAGHAAGILRTKQEPVRIFQYYRSDLIGADCLRQQ